jgi:mono/diheme cytochrome c family protein
LRPVVLALGVAVLLVGLAQPTRGAVTLHTGAIARGQTLVAFGACNDCHTPGWRESDGTLPVSQWMVGSPVGFRGPWGTVYPANVRREFAEIDEDQWLAMVRTRAGHPPMTWHDLRGLDTEQLRAIYQFIRSLGPAGFPSRPSLAPGREPKTPYYDVAPRTPPPS